MRLMVTLEHNGAQAQFNSSGAIVSVSSCANKKKINMIVKEGTPREEKRG